MPIGVPKVPYRLPGEIHPQWVDIYNYLSRERILFLTQDLDDETTNQLIGLLLYLGSENKKRDVFLYVNSSGGPVIYGLSIVDTMQYIKVAVNTINVGTATSIASFVVARGQLEKRLALPHARFIIHQPDGGSNGQATEIFSETEEVIRLRRAIGRLYSEFTGQPLSQIAKDLNRDAFLNAKQACKYGLIDLVGKNTKLLITISSFDLIF